MNRSLQIPRGRNDLLQLLDAHTAQLNRELDEQRRSRSPSVGRRRRPPSRGASASRSRSSFSSRSRSESPFSSRSKSPYSARSKSPYSSQSRTESSYYRSSSDGGSVSDGDGDVEEQRRFVSSEGSVLLDPNGCCVYHPFVQLQRRRSGGGGWRILCRTCAMCTEEEERKRKQSKNIVSSTMAKLPRKLSRLGLRKKTSPPNHATDAMIEIAQRRAQLERGDDGEGSYNGSDSGDEEESQNDQPKHHRERPGDDSITPSFLESDDDESDDDGQSSASSYQSESSGDDDDAVELEVNSDGEIADANIVRRNSRDSTLSSGRDRKKYAGGTKGSDEPHDKSVDMSRVESALRKIKSRTDIKPPEEKDKKSTKQKSKSSTKKSSIKRGKSAKAVAKDSPRPPPPRPAPTATPPPSSSANSSVSGSGSSDKPISQPPQFRRRPPPPPPPPRPPISSVGAPPGNSEDSENTTAKAVNLDMSMAVLNPHAEEEDEFGIEEDEHDGMHQQQQYQQTHPAAAQHQMIVPFQQQQQPAVMSSINEISNYDEPKKSNDWRKYSTAAKRRDDDDKPGRRRPRLLSGRNASSKLAEKEREQVHHVKSMPFTDHFGDFGYYTGQVDDDGRPNGKGSMKYENGVFFEGTYTNGCQDQKAAANYDRIRGGFTSWKGTGKSGTKSGMTLPWNAGRRDAYNPNEKVNVRGMEWTDLNGQSGRYTGEVNSEELPHGNGIMKYDFGLIAEGEWNNGILKEGPGDRMMAAAQAGVGSGGTVAPGMAIGSGMSVGPGAVGFASGAVSVLGAG